jgi:hypothetical protein
MKNIHVLPTEKPSRLHKIENEWGLTHNANSNPFAKQQNIYITSDEYIGLSYYLDGNLVRKGVVDDKEYWEVRKDYKKIILTTDQDLIKDGVQAIDDEFLEWFVKNPSCEEVEVKFNNRGITGAEKILKTFGEYKIIIPRTTQQIINEDYAGGLEMGQIPLNEEPKQETLEEVAENYKINIIKSGRSHRVEYTQQIKLDFIAGAKWQQEQDKNKYSEEEFPQPNIIDNWLEKNGDPEIDKQVEQEAKELCEQNKISQEELERAIFAPINLYSAIKFLFKQIKNK